MGNLNIKYKVVPEDVSIATYVECSNQVHVPKEKYSGFGDTQDEALNELTKTCRYYGLPPPENIPGTDNQWFCGTLQVPGFVKKSIKYNPVWFNKRNERHTAYIYYPAF